ncbi:MAG: hypothetical protein AAF488_09690, partial [Planctomycetota bacterium]
AIGSPNAVATFQTDRFLASRELDLDWRERDPLPGLLGDQDGRTILIDTPDFDSVEDENRRRAEALLLRADRIVVVITPEKYGDASVWNLIDAVRPLGSVAGCILNKFETEGPREDLTRLLEEREIPAPISVPRVANAEELRFDEETHGAVAQLVRFTEPTVDVLRHGRAAAEKTERETRSQTVAPWLTAQRAATDTLREELDRQREGLRDALSKRMALEIDSALKRELESRFLEQVQRIDLLREPRRWLSMPFTWVKSWVTGEESSAKEEPEATSEWLTRLYLDRYREFLFEFAGRLREATTRAREAATPEIDWLSLEQPPEEAVEDALRSVFERLETQIREESERIAEGLPTSSKVGFYSSQVLFHTMVSVVCVKTGGLFTPAEMAAQGLISPFVARIAGQYVSSQQAEQVEGRLESFFHDALLQVTVPLLAPLERQIERVTVALPAPGEWDRAITEWDVASDGTSR